LRLNWRKFGDYSVDELLPTPHLVGFLSSEKTIHQQKKGQNFTSLISKFTGIKKNPLKYIPIYQNRRLPLFLSTGKPALTSRRLRWKERK
jgi:hypothetical protein